ncbi:hypothetical protein XA68_12064 [Ophiocordyceps unilateralis]|uniref:Uncharacterized protein n=1 Tax=Ophiocordyceps unilateralis TaxID=268505 RepID=A0A2A9PE30_OPHUN|nr:hypothetical protein XA68_12064 [Ophiocordyceps unilateralis]
MMSIFSFSWNSSQASHLANVRLVLLKTSAAGSATICETCFLLFVACIKSRRIFSSFYQERDRLSLSKNFTIGSLR